MIARFATLRPARPRTMFAAMSRVAVVLIAICFAGGLVACAAFVWAALRGELTDTAEAAFLVFDGDEPGARAEPR